LVYTAVAIFQDAGHLMFKQIQHTKQLNPISQVHTYAAKT